MNKVFKVIWNHATQTWTAVSELGHAKGKTKSKKIVKLTALAGAVIGSLAASQTAMAVTDLGTNDAVNIAANNVANPPAGREAVAVGQNAGATHQHSIAIGRNATAKWQILFLSVKIPYQVKIMLSQWALAQIHLVFNQLV